MVWCNVRRDDGGWERRRASLSRCNLDRRLAKMACAPEAVQRQNRSCCKDEWSRTAISAAVGWLHDTATEHFSLLAATANSDAAAGSGVIRGMCLRIKINFHARRVFHFSAPDLHRFLRLQSFGCPTHPTGHPETLSSPSHIPTRNTNRNTNSRESRTVF